MNRILLPLLTLGLSLAPILCWAAEPNADQAKAVAEIEKPGGRVKLDDNSPGKPVLGVDFSRSRVTDTGPLQHERYGCWVATSQRIDPTPRVVAPRHPSHR